MATLTPTKLAMNQANRYISDRIDDLKVALGFNEHPQAKIQHNREYLNDIAKGNWKLKRWTKTSIKYRPVVGVPADFMMDNVKLRKFDRNPLMEQIRKGHRLRSVKTNDKTRLLMEKGWKSRKPVDHKKLLAEITAFDRTKLRTPAEREKIRRSNLMQRAKGWFADKIENLKNAVGYYDYPQRNVQHPRSYLNDIAQGNWKLRRWTKTSIKYRPVVGVPADFMMDNVKIRRFDRNPLMEQIRKGHKLRRVQTNDRSRALIEKGWKSRKALDRKKYLNEITGFNMRRLKHVQTVDKANPQLKGLMMPTQSKKAVLQELRTVRPPIETGSS